MNNVYLYHPEEIHDTHQAELHQYAKQKGFKEFKTIKETNSEAHWHERELAKTLKTAKTGDTVIAYDALHLAPSANQTLELLMDLVGRGVNLHFAKYNMTYHGDAKYQLAELLGLLRKIESDYVSRRNMEAIERRRNMGVILGRPKGRKNKALKLDKFKKEITRYLELSISKASIAKLVNCHPQTLYDWIERNSIPDRKPRKPRVKKLENA